MANKIQLRRDTAVAWSLSNPILSQGEAGYDLTNKVLKIGDGVTRWDALPVIPSNQEGTQGLQGLQGLQGTQGIQGPLPTLVGIYFGPAYNVQVEDGDGTTDTFVLAHSVTNEQQLLVTVAGIPQTPGADYAYTAASTSLSFTEAPALGDRIVIRYLIYTVI